MSIGDAYFLRRSDVLEKLHENWGGDPVILALLQLPRFHRVLEIGCANGWRLDIVKELFKCKCTGIDPSMVAITNGKYSFNRDIEWRIGTADNLGKGSYDVVIFGFCLYACKRKDLFKIAYEADRVLEPGGHLVIYDFHPEVEYSNVDPDGNGDNYKMQYVKMFYWHPLYKVVYRNVFPMSGEPTESAAVYMLRKSNNG